MILKQQQKKHQYDQYCGFDFVYDKNGKKKKRLGTPDLCIAEKWHWENKEKPVTYRGIVEIKSPILDPITGRSPEGYKKHTLDEIKRYLTAERNSKIILTDGLTWTFYDKEKYNEPKPIAKPIYIGKIDINYRETRGYKNRIVNEKDVDGAPIIEKINMELQEVEFSKLQEELKNFICKDK